MADEYIKTFLINQIKFGPFNLLESFFNEQYYRNTSIARNECRNDLIEISSGAAREETWALTVLDSYGRAQPGLMGGSLFNLDGNYQQCLDSATVTGSRVRETKYCIAHIDLTPAAHGLASLTGLPRTMFSSATGRGSRFGICVPARCGVTDLVTILKQLTQPRVTIGRIECTDGAQGQTIWSISFIVMLSLAIMSCIWLTYFKQQQPDSNRRCKTGQESVKWYTRALSLKYSIERLTAKRSRIVKSLNLNALDGLRVLSMLWTITMHSYNFGFQWLSYDNVKEVESVYRSPWIQWVANGTFSVDNFFLISGLLACLKISKKELLKQAYSKQINTLIDIGLRYLRLVPTMMFLILFSVTILPILAYGPNWSSSTMMFDQWCRTNWPLNSVMVHNLIGTPRMCFSHSWYVAVDFQLFVVLHLLFLCRNLMDSVANNNNNNKWFLAGCILISQASVAAIVYFRELPSIPLVPAAASLGSINDYFGWLYIKPYYWLSSYFMGAMLAIHLNGATKINSAESRRWYNHFILHLLPLILIALLLLSTWPFFLGTIPFSELQSTSLSLVSRPLWSACIVIILRFAILSTSKLLTLSRSMITTRLIALTLSSNLWLVPSRLSYSAFLLHPIVMAIFYGSRTENFQFSHSLLLYFTIGNIVLSYVGALFLYLFIENPVCVLIECIRKQQFKILDRKQAILPVQCSSEKCHPESPLRLASISRPWNSRKKLHQATARCPSPHSKV